MRIPIIINKEQAKKLKKLYKGNKNVTFVDLTDNIYDELEKGKPLHKIIDDKKTT